MAEYDFTTFTVIDDDSVNPTITANKISVSGFLSRAERLSVYEPETNQDFFKSFEIKYSAIGTGARVCPLAFSTAAGDIQDWGALDYTSVTILESGGVLSISLGANSSSTYVGGVNYTYTLNTVLYGTLTKTGTSVNLSLYTDSTRLTKVHDTSVTLASDDTYTHVIVTCGNDSGIGGSVSGYVANIQDAVNNLTVNVTGTTGQWTATGAATFGPFSLGTQTLPAGDYVVSFSTETGFVNPGSRSISLQEDVTLNARYITDVSLPTVIQGAECAFALGGNYTDLSGNGLDLGYIGNGLISLATDGEGTANSSDSFTAQADSGLVVSDTSLALRSSFWFNVRGSLSDLADNIVLMSQWETVIGFKKLFDCRLLGALGIIRVRMLDSSDANVNIDCTTALTANTFYNIFFQFNVSTGTATLYLDNTLEATEVFTRQTTATSDSISIGNWTGTDTLSAGIVDDVVVGTGILSSTDRTSLFDMGTDFEEGTVGTLDVTITGTASATYEADNSVTTYGPYSTGSQNLLTGTYDITFLPVTGYSTPSAQTGVVITAGGTTSISATYTAYTTTEVYVRPLGATYGNSSGDSETNAISGFPNINQAILAFNATIRVRGTHQETLILERDDLNIDGDIDGSNSGVIDGKIEITGTWSVYSGNVYRIAVGTPNVDYIQETAPTSPSVGEIWYISSYSTTYGCGLIGLKWDGTAWQYTDDWFLKPYMVWLDDENVLTSKYPSTTTDDGFVIADGYITNTNITHSGLSRADDYWVGGYAVAKIKTWVAEERLVLDSTGTSVTLPQFRQSIVGSPIHQHFFYIENVVGEIASEGQWAYKDGYLYMWFDDDPTNHTVHYSGVNHGVFSDCYGDIAIDGLEVKHTNDSPVALFNTYNVGFENNDIHDCNARGDFGFSGSACHFQGDGITTPSSVNINNNKVRNITGGDGIKALLFTTGEIHTNKVNNIGYRLDKENRVRGRCEGIKSRANVGVDIYNNTVAVTAYTSIQPVVEGGDVYGNYCSFSMLGYQDGAGVYGGSDGFTDTTVRNNVVTHVLGSSYDTARYVVVGIYCDANSSDVLIDSNDVYKVEEGLAVALASNSSTTPLHVFSNNNIYADALDQPYYNPFGATVTNNTFAAESAWTFYTLTVTTNGGWWSEDGGTTQRISGASVSIAKGAYVITYEDNIDDEVIALSANTVLDRADTETTTLDSNWPVGAEIVIDGITYTADATIELEAGSYTAVPNTVAGYTNDGTQNFTVVIGTPQTVTLNYTGITLADPGLLMLF